MLAASVLGLVLRELFDGRAIFGLVIGGTLMALAGLATMAVDYDTAETIQQVANMSVKIQPYDVAKKDLIESVYRESLSLWEDFLVRR